MTRERSLEIVRQVIDIREQLHKLSRETGLDFLMSSHANNWRDVLISVSGDARNFFTLRRFDDDPESISLIWHGDRGSEEVENLTQVDLSLLEGEDDDLD